ncbi:hypothetical protein L1987_16561 [Smallanthus sonchifolius]|uniref:Uncharacterized protein n=1 Tax=Smallanthus sonchifolius TaxID=185202 RepID=A0ACB9IWY1_9ASTR|nr:hypothetical protein L1987_16561 [Smallanthus sonchifolius]
MGGIVVPVSSQYQSNSIGIEPNLVDVNQSEARNVLLDSVSPVQSANPLLCKKQPIPTTVLAGKNVPTSVHQETNLECPHPNDEVKSPGEEGFVMVSRKHRRPKVKIMNNSNGQIRGKKVVNNKGPKLGDKQYETGPRSSSEPIIQKKMGELHQQFKKTKMPSHRALNDGTNSHKKPLQPNISKRKPNPNLSPPSISQPSPNNHAQSKTAGKNLTAHNFQPMSIQSPVPRNVGSVIPTSNPFDVLDVDMSDADKGVAATPDGGDLRGVDKFYELSSDSIATVLNFNPSKLTVPRIHDLPPVQDDPDTMEEMGEEDVPDFNITNAQKKAICNSLIKYGAVKADVQANWEHGEWEFFHYQVKQLNIDPDTCVEDVDSDSNETAQFFKFQMQQGAPGSSVTQAHPQTKLV